MVSAGAAAYLFTKGEKILYFQCKLNVSSVHFSLHLF